MQKNAIIAIVAIVAVVAVGAGAYFAMHNDNGSSNENIADNAVYPDETVTTFNDSSVRLRIYGNANGDDVIDKKDIDAIQAIIDNKSAGYKQNYYFADADHNGYIDTNDIEVVKKIIAKENVKMWYETSFSTKDTMATGENLRKDAYVNYPIGTKVGCEYLTVDFLSVLGVYQYFKATDNTMANNYGNSTYPGIESMPKMGPRNSLDIQTLESMYQAGDIDTVIMWSGGTSTMYLWDDAVNSGVADHLSVVMLTCQGKNCINGIIMLACMFGDQSLSDNYVKWYDEVMEKLSVIGKTVPKKTLVAVQMFDSTTDSGLQLYKQYQSPALWFSEVFNFAGTTAGVSGFQKLGSTESLEAYLEKYNVVEMIAMTQPAAADTYENYNSWVESKMSTLFNTMPVYENEKIYTIDFNLMPYFGGPAMCLILAAYLYPDDFDMEESMNSLQTYIDNFMPTEHDAHVGFTYTGDGYYKG